MIKEKRKQRGQELRGPFISFDRSPYPPSRHEKWKRAHQRLRGEFNSETTRAVAKNIVSRLFFQHY